MAGKAVNKPIDPEARERDINHKLQFYGIYSAFASGKVPSNKQIDVALNSVLESKALTNPSEELTSETYKIINATQELITNARNLILVKNEGNLIQEFIWDAENFQKPVAGREAAQGFDKEAEKQRGAQAAQGLKTLGTLLITNGQFRKLLGDATILLRDMAGDTAQKAAGFVRPSEDELAQIDQPAEEGVFHEKPNFSKESLKAQAKSARQKGKRTEQPETTDGVAQPTETGVNGAQKEEAKKKSRQTAERTKAFLAQKMPQERREQTIWRLKKMIVEIQGHPDYQDAIETLLSLAETYTQRWRETSRQGAGKMKGAREETGMKSLETKLRTLLERFANSTSAQDLFDSLKKISQDADKDERLRNWFSNADVFMRKCLREQGYVLQDEATEEWQRIYDEGRFLFRDRYREDANRVVGELKFMGDQFDQDPLNRAFKESLQKLFHDLGYDDGGKLAFKKHLMKDFAGIIMPGIFENLHYVPLPRIEVSDPMIDVVIENLAVETDNLMPNVVEIGSDNYWRWGRKKIGNKRDNKIMLSATGMQTDWKDVSFYIKRKTGFPRISDTGVMDVFLGGEGFSFRVIGSSARDADHVQFFKPEKVSVTIKNLDIKLKQSKHKFLFAVSRPMLLRLIKPAIRKVLEKQIKEYFTKADAFAHEVDKEAHRSRELARNDPEDQRNIYSHYISAFRKQMMERKEKAKQEAEKKPKRDTKVHVAMNTYDSIFPDVKLPSGISSKASEYKDLAAKGERWESPVFGIGKSAETRGLPKLAAITRKPHSIEARPRKPEPGAETAPRQIGGLDGLDGLNGVDGGASRATPSKATGGVVDGMHTIPGTSCPV